MLTPEQLIPVVRGRWRVVIGTWASVVAAALAISLALPPRYEATASVVVDMGNADLVGGQAVFKPAGSVSTHIATQIDVFKSEEVARRALRSLGLQKQQEWIDKWQDKTDGRGDFESWLAGRLLRQLDVRPSRDSNVLVISFTSPDPELSAALANAFVQAYIDTSLQMRVGPARQFNAFFAERAKPLRDALDQARSRLSAYEKEHGVVVGEERDPEAARLAELTSQLIVQQDAAADAASRRRQAAAAPGRIAEVRGDPEVSALGAEIAGLETRLAQLKTEFGDQHPSVMQTRESIRDSRRRMGAAMQRAAGSLEVPLKAAQARVDELQAAIERQRAVVLQRKSQRDGASAHLRDVENAQKAYDAVLARASQTALEGANTTQTNVSVLKSATAPFSRSPLVLLNVVVAVVLGLLLGIARALFAEHRDRRLRTVADITHCLRQPLLLKLPDGRVQREAPRRSGQTQERLVHAQPRLAAPK